MVSHQRRKIFIVEFFPNYGVCSYVFRIQETHAYIGIYIYMYICTYIGKYMHTYMHTCIHTYILTCICSCIHTYMHTYIHIHTYVHTYIHACIHTYVMYIVLLKFSIYRIFSVLMFMSEVPILGYSFERVQFLAKLTNHIKHWHRMFVYVA